MRSNKSEYKTISIFGSTGSVGKNTIDVIKNHQNSSFNIKVKSLIAQNNYKFLAKNALDLKPEVVVIGDEKHNNDLKNELAS